MKKEVIKFDKKEPSKGDIELNEGNWVKAYYYYALDEDIEGFYKLAKFLEEKGKKKRAAEILAEAHQLYNAKKGGL